MACAEYSVEEHMIGPSGEKAEKKKNAYDFNTPGHHHVSGENRRVLVRYHAPYGKGNAM